MLGRDDDAVALTDSPPCELVGSLRRGDGEARGLLASLCFEPIERLVDRLHEGRQAMDRKTLSSRCLHWLEMFLRSRDPAEFAGMSREVFVARSLLAVLRMLSPAEGTSTWRGSANSSLCPPCPTYLLFSYCRPCEQVGGDSLLVDGDGAGGLWVLVADVTGHGYPAYILADGLGHLWRTTAIAGRRTPTGKPSEVLAVLDRELMPVLPDEVFVEAILGRFPAAGNPRIAGAGMCRVLLRRAGPGSIEVHQLGGTYLGMGMGVSDEFDTFISPGDEVTLASDGLYEQHDHEGRQIVRSLVSRIGEIVTSGRNLHEALLEVVEYTLAGCIQQDDITIITIALANKNP